MAISAELVNKLRQETGAGVMDCKNLYARKCLLHMPFPKEEKFRGTYGDFVKSKIAVLKENIVVRRFCRMEACK